MTNNNDVIRSVRYALDLSEPTIVDVFKLADYEIDRIAVSNLLKKEDEPGFVECSDEILAFFLDGLVTYKRGKREGAAEVVQPEPTRLTNNMILKKLRVAFELKEEDLHEILKLADFELSKPEMSALFRKKGHKNYRICGDQLLRYFLKGLTIRLRG
ncbi:DUF1456 family protein [Sulfurirhabdus autotrophica]|uniref:Uncharacterized protein YehS (DUF1456 family) n=1 Tax=Sulfurirhabdus autotrophica TaxID=1706046 RepID=A0A4R3XRF3_9PROT|nr:DUF1456 family protein [Sulfurirhabdus autotrophica]TCV80110.1 uncharacterized protein YehS (DUF1456 family) [Sulfurirhabdus autotrophica]